MKTIDLIIGLGIIGVCASPIAFASQARANDERVPDHATRAAISALYVANDTVQRAVTHDYCEMDAVTMIATQTPLTGENARQYGHVVDALQAAFDASEGTDSALMTVSDDFCFGASER